MALNVKLEAFEGPLDLLLHLIEKNQINIYDIPISELTDQYLSYLEGLEKLDINLASEFLLMAATLLSIKSRMLLPPMKSGDVQMEISAVTDVEDPRNELVDRLMEYKKYKDIAMILKEKEESESRIFKRKPEDLSFLWEDDFALSKITFDDLISTFSRIIRNQKVAENLNPRTILKEPLPLKIKIKQVYSIISSRKKVSFRELFRRNASRLELIVTFLAVLELIKLNKIKAYQNEVFGEITVVLKEEA
ncbi:segregation and condensation protein A [Thermosediminibacter litoriperuensis]|uniref:Segregation and condensation protein A n=1 Tax=Thermosediminibacter litoriperuensis TaxID=291989 RepID=A0A5S5AYV2_9FIRM|nr:segregation/condensation protein A [Thermosediminibacter litoriperuensis]TYP59891.1 condensin subunit ScpA [Thermosediminibacter litoriperuensis]